MIRPITVATFLMACGSGLYLYQEKHDAQVLDQQIARTVRETAAFRDQSRVLAAEWTMLNDPERLRQYSDTYLSLKSILPTQFTNLANLDSRLPAIAPPRDQDTDQTVASVDESAQPAGTPAATDGPPRPPLPPAASQVAQSGVQAVPGIPAAHPPAEAVQAFAPPATMQAERRPAVAEPRRIAEARPADQRPIDLRPPEARAPDTRPPDARVADARAPDAHTPESRVTAPRAVEPHPVDPRLADSRPLQQQQRPIAPPVRVASGRPVPYAAPRAPAPVSAAPTQVSAPYSGSLLGMARSATAAPRPMPVNASNWYNPN